MAINISLNRFDEYFHPINEIIQVIYTALANNWLNANARCQSRSVHVGNESNVNGNVAKNRNEHGDSGQLERTSQCILVCGCILCGELGRVLGRARIPCG